MRTRSLYVALLAGCGGAAASPPDGALVVDARADATVIDAGPRCDPTLPFGTQARQGALDDGGSAESPSLSPDERTIYFSSDRAGTGGYDILSATRSSRDAAFGAPSRLPGVNTGGSERGPVISDDGLTLYAYIGIPPAGDVAMATRAAPGATFGSFAPIAAIDSPSDDESGSAIAAPRAIYLSSARGGDYDLYRAEWTGTSFAPPARLDGDGIDTGADETDPVVSADELTLYFASNRSGGLGGYDIYVATRATPADSWGAPVELHDLDSTSFDAPAWISPDGCALYYTTGPLGGTEIWEATRLLTGGGNL